MNAGVAPSAAFVVAMTWDAIRDCPGVPTCTTVTDTTTLTLLRYTVASAIVAAVIFC